MKRDYHKTLIDAHRYVPTKCWYCGHDLKPVFTTVRKNGMDLRVHPTCRPEALTVVGVVSPLEIEPA